MLFWKKKKSRKNTYKNNAFPRYVDKMAGEFDAEKFNFGIYSKNGGRNAAVHVAADETTILSENMRLSIHDEKTHLNNNMFIIADDSYANKLIMANILQCNSSFAVADVGGKMLAETRAELLDAGYDIQVLDVSRPEMSAKYNPLRFVDDKEDAEMLARCIDGDNFGALSDMILQVLSDNAEEKQTMESVAKLVAGSKPGLCGIDIFLRPEITNLTSQNDMILDTAGERLTGIFIVCPEEKSDADVLANIMMMQLHRVLVKAAKEKYNGERLPYLTRLYFNHIERYGGNPFFLYMDRGDCFLNVRSSLYVITRLCGTGSIEPPLGWRAHLILIPTFRYIYPDVTSSSELQYITASAFAKIHPASSPYIFFTKLSPRQANVYAILYLLTFRKQSPLSIYKKNGFPPYLSMWLKYSLVRKKSQTLMCWRI